METGIPGFLFEELEEGQKEEKLTKKQNLSSFNKEQVIPLLEEEMTFGYGDEGQCSVKKKR